MLHWPQQSFSIALTFEFFSDGSLNPILLFW